MNQLMVQYVRRYPPPVTRKYQTEQRYRRNVTFRHQFRLYYLRFHTLIFILFQLRGLRIIGTGIDEFARSGDVVGIIVLVNEAGRYLFLGFQSEFAESVCKRRDIVVAR